MAKKIIPYDEVDYYNQLNQGKRENSAAWANADEETRQGLHRANEQLYQKTDAIDGGKSTFNKNTGAWNTAYDDNNGNWYNSSTPSQKAYVAPNQEKINNLASSLESSQFSYDPNSDPSYGAYKNMYNYEGDRAQKSVLADIATAQGGVSSYAAQAAQQAANLYARQLTDKIPELERLAYEKYNTERNNQYNLLNTYQNMDNINYGRWSDDYNRQYQSDVDDYNRNYQREYDEYNRNYQAERDAKSDEQQLFANDITTQQLDMAKKDQNFNHNITYNQLLQSMNDSEWNKAMANQQYAASLVEMFIQNGCYPPVKLAEYAGLSSSDLTPYIDAVNLAKGGGSPWTSNANPQIRPPSNGSNAALPSTFNMGNVGYVPMAQSAPIAGDVPAVSTAAAPTAADGSTAAPIEQPTAQYAEQPTEQPTTQYTPPMNATVPQAVTDNNGLYSMPDNLFNENLFQIQLPKTQQAVTTQETPTKSEFSDNDWTYNGGYGMIYDDNGEWLALKGPDGSVHYNDGGASIPDSAWVPDPLIKGAMVAYYDNGQRLATKRPADGFFKYDFGRDFSSYINPPVPVHDGERPYIENNSFPNTEPVWVNGGKAINYMPEPVKSTSGGTKSTSRSSRRTTSKNTSGGGSQFVPRSTEEAKAFLDMNEELDGQEHAYNQGWITKEELERNCEGIINSFKNKK